MEELYPDQDNNYYRALIFASKGQKEKALNTYNTSAINPRDNPLFSLLGMNEEALIRLSQQSDRQLNRQRSNFLSLKYNPYNDNIRSDPRFQEILAKHKELYEENLAKYGDIEELLN